MNRRSIVAVARVAATAALEEPAVLGLHDGAVGEIATYGEGRRVGGVRVLDHPTPRVRLHLVVRFGTRLDEVAAAVRSRVAEALRPFAPEFAAGPIDVHLADVSVEERPPSLVEEGVSWS